MQDAAAARRLELALERERKAALMQHLFEHGLTSDGGLTRDTPYGRIPQRWHLELLGECAVVQTGLAKGRRLAGGSLVKAPYLRVANVQNGYLDLSEVKHIELLASELPRYSLKPGDLLLTEGGDRDKLGRGFIWSGQIPGCVHQNHIFAVRATEGKVTPDYLAYLVQSDYGRSYFLSVAHKTTNLASINTEKLRRLPVPLPPLPEQEQIVATLRACDAKIAALEREAALLDELFRAMLEELISGRLSALPLVETAAGEHASHQEPVVVQA